MKYLKKFNTHAEYELATLDLPNVSYCVNNNDIHYNPYDPYNGHAYVDLGLPSGTKWATMNVGANSETDTGLYFAWGETTGYITNQVGIDKQFTWNDYKYGTSSDDLTKYNSIDGKTELDLEDDAARANWGGKWKMPSNSQMQELCNTQYVTNRWVQNYNNSGVNGRLFTSVSNGNTLFFPASGYGLNGGISTTSGYFWETSLSDYFKHQGKMLTFGSQGGVDGNSYNMRCYGQSVRAVVD